MTEGPVYCLISGCTPEILYSGIYGHALVKSALEALGDRHETSSQDDFCVIGPIRPRGHPDNNPFVNDTEPRAREVYDERSEEDIRVIPHCRMGKLLESGYEPRPGKDWYETVSLGDSLDRFMVQTYALDIMALATQGRMTALRLWRLAKKQGSLRRQGRPYIFKGVDYGEISFKVPHFPNPFPGFSHDRILDLGTIEVVDIIKERFVHEGQFWVWMAPDRFPTTRTEHDDITLALPEVPQHENCSTIENLPLEVFGIIISFLSLRSLFNLACASRQLRSRILGNDYFACIWIDKNAPWWIPVPTRTPRKDDKSASPTTDPETYPASEWGPHAQLAVKFPVGLNWAYVGRCVGSGSMRNRRRIWNTALDIERTADLAGL